MRDINNPRHLALIVSEAKDAVNNIISDKEMANSFRSQSLWLFVCEAIEKYAKEVEVIVAALDGECTPEEAFDKYTCADIARMVDSIAKNDFSKELIQLFSSALKKKGASSSGNAQETTPV